MPKKKPAQPAPYPDEFRARLTEWARAGQTPEEPSRKFEPGAQTIRDRVRQADLDDGRRRGGLTTEEREALVRLRRAAEHQPRRTAPSAASCC
jgi:transposase